MTQYTKWHISPSKLEASGGCPCYEENFERGASDKERGTDLHEYMEHLNKDIRDLEPDDQEAVLYCRDWLSDFIKKAGPFDLMKAEVSLPATELGPRGKVDYLLYNKETRSLYIVDWKFGVQPVPEPASNLQIKAYLNNATQMIEALYEEPPLSRSGAIVQPALDVFEVQEISDELLAEAAAEAQERNRRVAFPFKQPDPSDPDKCAKCLWVTECPSVQGAITTIVSQASLLPVPSDLDPSAIVSERDRIIAQDLAKILVGWAEAVKKNNREYAMQHGGTLGGIYNISTRSNGYAFEDLTPVAQALVDKGHLSEPSELLGYVRLNKGALVQALDEKLAFSAPAEGAPLTGAEVVKELELDLGVPRPEVAVFSRGGKKKVASLEEALNIPMLTMPWTK